MQQQGIDVRFDLRNSLLLLGEPDRLAAYVREAEGIARTLNDHPRLARASAYLSHYYWRTGQSPAALAHGREALATADALSDFALRVAAKLCLGLASHTAGELVEAEALLCRVVDALPGNLARERLGQHAYPAVNARAHARAQTRRTSDLRHPRRRSWDSHRRVQLPKNRMLAGSTGLEPATSGVTAINSRAEHPWEQQFTAGATFGCHAQPESRSRRHSRTGQLRSDWDGQSSPGEGGNAYSRARTRGGRAGRLRRRRWAKSTASNLCSTDLRRGPAGMR